MADQKTFGQVFSEKRRAMFMTQRDLASQIKREDDVAISAAYLNDIEHDRRSPSPDVVKQFAKVLKLDPEYLTYLAGRFPHDHKLQGLSENEFVKGMHAFRRATGTNKKNG